MSDPDSTSSSFGANGALNSKTRNSHRDADETEFFEDRHQKSDPESDPIPIYYRPTWHGYTEQDIKSFDEVLSHRTLEAMEAAEFK